MNSTHEHLLFSALGTNPEALCFKIKPRPRDVFLRRVIPNDYCTLTVVLWGVLYMIISFK